MGVARWLEISLRAHLRALLWADAAVGKMSSQDQYITALQIQTLTLHDIAPAPL